jgi:hypothetical protein
LDERSERTDSSLSGVPWCPSVGNPVGAAGVIVAGESLSPVSPNEESDGTDETTQTHCFRVVFDIDVVGVTTVATATTATTATTTIDATGKRLTENDIRHDWEEDHGKRL